jgi:hypothetical protein
VVVPERKAKRGISVLSAFSFLLNAVVPDSAQFLESKICNQRKDDDVDAML